MVINGPFCLASHVSLAVWPMIVFRWCSLPNLVKKKTLANHISTWSYKRESKSGHPWGLDAPKTEW